MHWRNKANFWIVFGTTMLVITTGVYFGLRKPNNSQQRTEIANILAPRAPRQAFPSPIASPFPFQEMTIPYLRQRNYESQLGQLQLLSENQNYTSYVTSYNSDGFRVNGLLTIPKGNPSTSSGNNVVTRWPAIVFVHGYIPPVQYRTTQNYASYVDYLARNGFVVFKIDLRGHDQSEGEAGGSYYSEDYIVDTLNARAALQAADFVNPDAVGLWGHSMAGNVTFRAFVAKMDIPALVIWAGAVYTYEDMSEFGIDDNSYRPPAQDSERVRERQRLRDTYGNFDPNSWFWQQVAPTNYLEGVRGAIQINHAIDDPVVSISYSRNVMQILDQTSIIHELKEYPSGGHNISGDSFTAAMQNTVAFFKKHLQ
ncbi:alpha/beta fold hydrolase [Candidatus Microgenomates bacterium]|nr:MAG: alpha/beta fold hydrolase [Candidatus Microgenomates bacterium]